MEKSSKFSELKDRIQSDYNKTLSWQKEKLQILNQYVQNKPKLTLISSMAGVIIFGASFGIFQYQSEASTLYHVYVDGKQIGTVDNKSVVDIWKSQELRKAQTQYGNLTLDAVNQIEFIEEKKHKGEYDNLKAIKALDSVMTIQAVGVELVVNDEVVGVVKDQATADRILSNLKQAYLPKTEKQGVVVASVDQTESKKVHVDSVQFKETISTEKVKVTPDQVFSEEDMYVLLKKGTLEEKKYIVQDGDTISEIAQRHSLTTKQLYQLNPQVKGEFINIGDELVVTAMTPKVTVEVKENLIQVERIPYKVIYQRDDSMYVNETKVIAKGSEGQKQVEYSIVKENGYVVQKTILNEEVLKEATDKVVLKGTKIVPAKGSGILSWPTVGGRITSYFGPRWGTHHDGIDISGVSDRTIKASDSGRVVYTGWKGGYGNTVIIDHGNGIQTLYGHLSKITVSIGEKVAKGQKIGVMGNTGRSTGTHLHFEVQVNGVPRNPLNYVGK